MYSVPVTCLDLLIYGRDILWVHFIFGFGFACFYFVLFTDLNPVSMSVKGRLLFACIIMLL